MKETGDFTADPRLIFISAIAIVVGALCALVAVGLMWMIAFFTNLFFYHQLAVTFRSPAEHQLGWAVVIVPIIGGLIIGLMARYGSERIRSPCGAQRRRPRFARHGSLKAAATGSLPLTRSQG